MDPNNIDLWRVIFHYHWNWAAIIVVLFIAALCGALGGRSGQ